MSKHRERVQFRRKIAARNSEATGYGAALIDIYRRALQGGSEGYLTRNQRSDSAHVVILQSKAQTRRDARNAKRLTLHFMPHPERPVARVRAVAPQPPDHHYTKLQSGQIVGDPQTMRTVKQEARRTRLQRRANFRIERWRNRNEH